MRSPMQGQLFVSFISIVFNVVRGYQYLFLAVGDWPEFEETTEYKIGKLGVFLNKLGNAVRELLMVHRHAFWFMKGEQGATEEHLRENWSFISESYGVRVFVVHTDGEKPRVTLKGPSQL